MKPGFYEDEVIEGFYVPSMLKKAWGAQLDVLEETDRICVRHNIPYFADWGTLLATIRHSGYIPWDDDLDISMRRSDYERFLKYAEDELPDGFKVMTFKNHPGHRFFVARIVGKPRICFEQDHLTRFHGFPYIAGIDLFVLDNVCRDRKKEELRSKKAEFVLAVADNIADGKTDGKQAEEQLCLCESYTGSRIDRRLSKEELRVRMYELVEELFASVPDEESDALVQMMPFGMYGNKRYIPKEYYRSTVRLPYMDTTMPVPLVYDAVMRLKFGNYMQIHKTWNGHDYPFFYGQHRDLLGVLDIEYPTYKATYEDIKSVRESIPEAKGDDIKDVVFIPFASKYWKYMEKLYDRYATDDNARVWVVPVPYYYKAWDGSLAEEVFDIEDYPEDLYLQDYKEVDLQSFHPNIIVIQNPFDEWNDTYSVPPQYYSALLKSYTDELIYIPFFVTDDFTKEMEREYINMDHYVCRPGVINADRVILPSETLKNTYIEKLTQFINRDDDEVRAALDKKLSVESDMVFSRDRDCKMASDNFGSDGRKRLVYFTTVSFLAENGHRAIDKIQRTLDVFEENRDRIKVIWITQCIKDNIKLLGENAEDDFRQAVRRFTGSGIGEYKEDIPVADNERYAGMCDAYYGDPSSLALSFFYNKKPVMIINADV